MYWIEDGDFKISMNDTCRRCDGNIGEAVEQEEKLCAKVEIVGEFTYLCDRVSAGGGYEAAVITKRNVGRLRLGNVAGYCMKRGLP